MLAFWRALFDSIVSAILVRIERGTRATEAEERPSVLRRAGDRIARHLARKRMQSSSARDGVKPDTSRTEYDG